MKQPLSPLLIVLCMLHPSTTPRRAFRHSATSATSAMEMSYCHPLHLQDPFLLDCESVLDKPLAHDPASDPGYVSAGSSLSPTSSMDSSCFSPASLQGNVGHNQDVLDRFLFSSPVEPQTSLCSRYPSTTKKSRSRYPGKKRQTASEREKLRMRDVTKALHHLRTYLPPCVAPAGQMLTKIDTLRFTIRYISYLSAQLGLSEEVLEQERSSAFAEQGETLDQPAVSYAPPESGPHIGFQASV